MKEETFLTFFLFLVITLYMVLAAFLFQYLESENELQSIKRHEHLFESLQYRNNISVDLMSQIFRTHHQACGIGMKSQENEKWNFVGSFYFAGTVLTTIGFGHASPATLSGRLVTIIFAVTSIPLYVLFMNVLLERIITLLKNFLNKLYKILPSTVPLKRHDAKTLPLSRILLLASMLFIFTVLSFAFVFSYFENWTYFQGIYFVVVAFTTIGLGDFVPSKFRSDYNSHPVYQLVNWYFVMIGVIIAYVTINLAATQIKLLLQEMTVKISSTFSTVLVTTDAKNTPSTSRKFSARPSDVSAHEDGIGLGSFSAIQNAIDRIRLKAQNNDAEGKSELKAVNTIEAILQNEYKKVQKMQGTDPAAKWRRAAARARISARRKQSNVYKSLLFDTDGPLFMTSSSSDCNDVFNHNINVLPKFKISCLKKSFDQRPRRLSHRKGAEELQLSPKLTEHSKPGSASEPVFVFKPDSCSDTKRLRPQYSSKETENEPNKPESSCCTCRNLKTECGGHCHDISINNNNDKNNNNSDDVDSNDDIDTQSKDFINDDLIKSSNFGTADDKNASLANNFAAKDPKISSLRSTNGNISTMSRRSCSVNSYSNGRHHLSTKSLSVVVEESEAPDGKCETRATRSHTMVLTTKMGTLQFPPDRNQMI